MDNLEKANKNTIEKRQKGRPEQPKESPFTDKFRGLIKGETMQEVADKIGVSRQTVSNWISIDKKDKTAKGFPDIFALSNISKAYNVSVDYLLGLSKYKNTDEVKVSIGEQTGLSEKSVEFLSDNTSSDLVKIINILIEEYVDKKDKGSILNNIIEFFSIDPIAVNEKDYYISKEGELRTPKANSAESDFKDFFKLQSVDIGGAIQKLLLEKIEKSLVNAKEKQTK